MLMMLTQMIRIYVFHIILKSIKYNNLINSLMYYNLKASHFHSRSDKEASFIYSGKKN